MVPAPPWPPSALIVTKQIPAGTVAALAWNPGVLDAATPPQNTQPNGTDGPCNGPNEAARAMTAGAAAVGVIVFAQNPTTGPLIGESINSFPTVQAAQSYMTATRTQLTSCTTYSSASSGTPTNYTVTQVAFSKVADDTLAIRLTTMPPQSTGSSGAFDDIIVRVGNNTVSLVEGALTGPDTSLEQQYVGKAISKLGVAIVAAKPPSTKTKKKK